MAYVAVNPLLFNAALAGFLAGMFGGQNPTDATAVDYTNVVSQANAFAEAVDTAIGVDASITAAGVAIAPTTGTIQEKEVAKPGILFGLAFAAAFQHYYGPIGGTFTPQDFTTAGTPGAALVAGIKAIYTQCVTAILTP
jgi:hypothetical protein